MGGALVSKSKEIAFCTHVSDDWFYGVGADKLIKSFKHFNPNVPLYVYDSAKIQDLSNRFGHHVSWLTLHPYVTREVMNMGYETVVHIDADSLVLGPLKDIILETPGDVLTVRNNNDKGFASKDDNPGITINGIKVQDYKNAGFVGIRDWNFVEEWIDRNSKASTQPHPLPYGEQDMLNLILQEGKYKETCLDPKNSDRHFGISCLDAKKDDPGFWGNMREININHKNFEDFEYYYKGKRIYVFHKAGGHKLPKLKLSEIFSPYASSTINKIIECY